LVANLEAAVMTRRKSEEGQPPTKKLGQTMIYFKLRFWVTVGHNQACHLNEGVKGKEGHIMLEGRP
jgi:hypothetical protein